MLVPVPVVEGVAVTVMHVVDVVAVLDGFVAAAGAVLMLLVANVLSVHRCTFVPVALVLVMHVSVVEVVGVALVIDGGVAAAGAVLVYVVLVDRMGGSHESASSACRMASRTMWMTWSSVIE